jgi:biopolymer transport protein ExbD
MIMHENRLLLRNKKRKDVFLDLTPLIDVVFLLLIFFMVSTSFEKTHWLDVQLPSVDEENKKAQSADKQIIIGIDAVGHYHVNEKTLGAQTAQQLKQYLQSQTNSDTVIIIQGDKNAPHGAVVQLLDVLGQLKMTQVHMAAVQG